MIGKLDPEAPKEGDELLYVDLTKERLENLYNNDNLHNTRQTRRDHQRHLAQPLQTSCNTL
jgi:hypothetical protein